MSEFIFLKGRAVNREDLPPLRSLFFGEGVFETFRWRRGFPILWMRHVERMRHGAGVLGISFPGETEIKEALEAAVLGSRIPDATVKICLLAQGDTAFAEYPESSSILVSVKPYSARPTTIRALSYSIRRSSASPIARIKSLNYLESVLAKREAVRRGADEAIFLNERGEVAEGSASNIFWLSGGKLHTPSTECGILPGITRGAVIEIAGGLGIEVCQGRFTEASVATSGGAFISNSLVGVQAVSEIDGVKFGDSGAEFLAIRDALFRRLEWL
ncbi:MAG: aminotransferase class IV [Deltaproteobacteria bacterium]